MLKDRCINDIAAQEATISFYARIAAQPLKIVNPLADHQPIAPLAGHGPPPLSVTDMGVS
ncbi:MAG TPA: hypothetical protein DEA71_14765 [Nitrospira sp.]|nr:hypothetical protein [Nitrospira sp.]